MGASGEESPAPEADPKAGDAAPPAQTATPSTFASMEADKAVGDKATLANTQTQLPYFQFNVMRQVMGSHGLPAIYACKRRFQESSKLQVSTYCGISIGDDLKVTVGASFGGFLLVA